MSVAEHEVVDQRTGIVLRRLVVGALDTNCWVVADAGSKRALVVDPGGDPERVLAAVGDLRVEAIVLTHTHWDHVLGVDGIADALGAPVLAHAADEPVWPGEQAHLAAHGHWDAGTATEALLERGGCLAPPEGRDGWSGSVTRPVRHGEDVVAGAIAARVLHTPGHTPGGISLALPGRVLTGDTLFPGGPGLTGWPLSDFPTIVSSIRGVLFALPDTTVVHPGHGADTTVGAERPHLADWIARGW